MADTLEKYREGVDRLTGLTDVDEVMKGLSRLLRKTVQSLWTVVYLLDREQRDFAPARSCGLPARYLPLFREMPLVPAKLPLLKTIIRKKQHLLIPDAGSSDMLTPKLRSILCGLSMVAVPMVVRNNVMGVVFVVRSGDHPPFSPEEITLIRDFVSHAALVASHIRLFDDSLEMALEMARRIEVIVTLDEINKAISSSLSPAKIIETAMEQIERIVQCKFVAILVEEKGNLVVSAVHAIGVTVPALFSPGATPMGNCLACFAFSKGKSRYIAHLGTVKRLHPFDRALAKSGIESVLAIPLVSKDLTKGVLMLGDTQVGQFVREDAFAIEKITAQMAVALENARLYEDMRSLFINTVASLANAIDAKSPWTKGHSERVMHGSATIAKEMGLDEAMIERVRLGGLLHDIGKIGIIEALLEKPEALSEDEFPPLRLHPEKGVAILAPIEQLRDVLPGILHHHERFNGTGYPEGLKGEAIPLEARIIAVADAFDAMVSDRPYKKGFSTAEALVELRKCAGAQFDPQVVEHFARYAERVMKK
ncbi:MAG TPA: HD domain-containing phosphohydrolase [Geobacteraceae bacterium]|nr:HD domain-containing phosphohydrolase [Geobacteraceae bacterium]